MTIATCVWAPDGIVLAADSRQVMVRRDQSSRTVSDNVQKIFELTEHCACLNYGSAAIGELQVSGLIQRFLAERSTMIKRSSPKHIAGELGTFLEGVWREQPPATGSAAAPIGLLVVGYGDGLQQQILDRAVPGGSTNELGTATKYGHEEKGEGSAIRRLLHGVDERLVSDPAFPKGLEAVARGLRYVEPLAGMTLQDRIDFAVFIVRTTVDIHRFTDGTEGEVVTVPPKRPVTGGPIEIAIIRPYSGFQWISEKKLTASTI